MLFLVNMTTIIKLKLIVVVIYLKEKSIYEQATLRYSELTN